MWPLENIKTYSNSPIPGPDMINPKLFARADPILDFETVYLGGSPLLQVLGFMPNLGLIGPFRVIFPLDPSPHYPTHILSLINLFNTWVVMNIFYLMKLNLSYFM